MIILDGVSAAYLSQWVHLSAVEWSALALMEGPDYVRAAHEEFINAGAQIITTNSYAVVPYHIGEKAVFKNGASLIELSGQLARQAVNSAKVPVKVAGSIPPIFGSYQPENFDPDL